MHYYLGQFEWIDDGEIQYWKSPYPNFFDLRQLSDQGISGGEPQGHCFIFSEHPISDDRLIEQENDSILNEKQRKFLKNITQIKGWN